MRQSITQSTKEVEAIVNSIPLSLNDITPNHLLAMKTKVLMPPAGVFLREDLCLRRRWKRGQHLAHDFWEKWRKEFIQVLQLRIKWTKPQRKLQRRDVILLNVPRNLLRLTRVEEVFPGEDGLGRKVKVAMATFFLDKQGRRVSRVQYLERPIHKLVLIPAVDQEIPDEEP